MRLKLIFIFMLTLPMFVSSQDSFVVLNQINTPTSSDVYLDPLGENPISMFSVYFNPLGFVQFGPIVNAELRLKENLLLNLHDLASEPLRSYKMMEVQSVQRYTYFLYL